jgi:hypothetical protein
LASVLKKAELLTHVEAAASAFPANAINVPRRNTIREDTIVPKSCFAASSSRQLTTKSRSRREAVIDS